MYISNELHTSSGVVNRVTAKDDISSLFGFDLDFIGHNGPDYSNERAIAEGFQSNLDYYYDKLSKQANATDERVVDGLVDVIRQDNYYQAVVANHYRLNKDNLYVNIAYVTDY